MKITDLQMDMHKSNSWLYYKLSIQTLGLVLRSGITITRPNPKADAKLQITSGVHHGGTIKVIVAGLPRTGTISMKRALEELGYGPCFHLAEPLCQFDNLSQSAAIVHTKDTSLRRRKLAKLLQGCEVTLEVPGSACLPDLLEMYPDAKVILTERTSAAVWLRSWRGFGIDLRSDCFRWVGYWVPGVVAANDLYRGWMQLSAERFGVEPEPSEKLYHAHSAWVKSIVPRERLLVFKCQDGWGPLCEFLGRQRPNPFPHGNEAGYLRYYKRVAMVLGVSLWLVVLAMAFLSLLTVFA
ncbi:hypothetical protein AN9208.2 [Aspergillus nidulans FGSC A4]|uniref:P-loop containing nucleoside triphosphate hydrolase protein n=1 Tax=Emericella nidulans (strain FGSC A4 / ATCC 38163 / CBS 112.46 / NRRL 194 / M139) TaxID=227321 RepID=Q5AR72_EMENI|nr:hypothetical protein [Aspergillus nidulans FGSC A4]EAA61499.1 hypothetical protein AN9208.2 [Aspergillus nidulans FGSC A4]CBF82322.1 TPA: conserved hypothetical protein [Aspergillus nidulans FGSC A4]|eukprot:XP_682477.1 hypothetical protein AN9208.2 [Aspergillus nidulans FGSC A4]